MCAITMTKYRCTQCNKLLLEASFIGCIKKICERCKNVNSFTINTLPSAVMLSLINEEALGGTRNSNNG
jgi:phage FluMu protein Com